MSATVYLLCAVVFFIIELILLRSRKNTIDTHNMAFNVFIAVFFAVVWPIVLCLVAIVAFCCGIAFLLKKI